MKTYLTFCLVFIITATSHAQQAASQSSPPPLPPGPLIKRAPNYSTWTVTCKGHPLEDKEPLKTGSNGEGSSKDKEPVTMVSTVIKTGSTILEQNVETNGQRRQIWHFSGFRIASGVSKPMVGPDYGGGDIFSINFSSNDFAGFDWLSKSTYTGMAKYQGNDCIVFSGTISPLTVREQTEERAFIERAKAHGQTVADALKISAIAYIDLESRLPVYAQFGQQKRIYQYGTPPTTPLTLPPELAGSINAYVQHINQLSAPPVSAY